MELYLLRHAIAEDHSSSGHDSDRRLTDEGQKKLLRVMERAHAAGVSPALIISSPYKRAIETAEIAARELGYAGQIERSNALVPDSSPASVWAELRTHRDQPSILLAGHEPLFSATVAWLVGSNRAMVEFRKATLVRIDLPAIGVEPRAVLQWMLTPKLS